MKGLAFMKEDRARVKSQQSRSGYCPDRIDSSCRLMMLKQVLHAIARARGVIRRCNTLMYLGLYDTCTQRTQAGSCVINPSDALRAPGGVQYLMRARVPCDSGAPFQHTTTGGAQLLTNRSSQAALLTPYTYVEPYPIGGNETAFAYYSQGMGLLCEQEGCPNGADFINHMGSALAAHTQNLLRTSDHTMVQVWMTSVQAVTTPAQLAELQEAGVGYAFDIAGTWSMNSPDPVAISFALLDHYGSP
jgi:hypothetical protein